MVKQGDHAQHESLVTEIWKGIYGDEEVALKLVRLSQDDGGGGGPRGLQHGSSIKAVQRVSAVHDPQSEAHLLLC